MILAVQDAPDGGSRHRTAAERLAEAAVVIGALAALVVYVAPTLERPLLEKHAFRQTQTAYAARVFHEQGIDLLHPQVPVLGEPFEIPFEFPLFQAAASLVTDAGIGEDKAMRLTALICFLVTALLLYGLVRHVAGRVVAIATLFAFVFTPFALVWSRASMIEYLVTAASIGFAWATIAWRESRRPLPAALALVAGLVAMLVKPTTAIFWIAPALAYRPRGGVEGSAGGRRDRVVTGLLVAVPIAAAAVWTRHADAVKEANPATAWLTSSELQEWNFGNLGQRFDPELWDRLVSRVGLNITGFFLGFLLVAAVALWRSPQRRFWLAVASAALLPPLVFTNLYYAHDYYLAAVTPAIAALIGLGAAFVWGLLPRQPLIRAAAVVVGLVLVYGTLELGRGYWLRIHGSEDDPQVLPLASELQSRTRPDDLVVVVGLEWSPAVLYYARRRGHMVVPANEHFAYDLVHDQGYRHLLAADPGATELELFERWRWVGALGPHTYTMADTAAELKPSELVVTDRVSALAVQLGRGGRLLGDGLQLRCGAPLSIPAGERGTWVRFAAPPAGARVSVSDALAPLPARPLLFAAPELAEGGRLTILCQGTGSLAVTGIFDAGPPS